MIRSNEERELVVRGLKEKRRIGRARSEDVRHAAERCGVSTSTVYRWLSNGPTPIARPKYELTERDQAEFFMACGNAALAYSEMRRKGGEAPPSYQTYVRAIRREFDAATIAAARHGARERAQYRIALRDRTYQRNERWEADHTQLEIEILPPGAKKPRLPWITWIIDCGTRYVAGWALSLRPTRGEVLAAIRVAVEHSPERGPVHGRPKMIVWDNGLEFTASAVSDCALMLGSYAAPTFPYSPKKKPKIEKVNQTLERQLLARLPFYTKGPRAGDGSLYGPPGGRLTLEALVQEVATWIDHYNAERPHRALGGRTPLEAWNADPTPIVAVSPEDLRRFTLERKTATVSHDAGITVQKRSFVAPELNGYVRRKVEVGLLPHDFSKVEVFVDDMWLCTARPVESLTPREIAEFKAHIAELNRHSANLIRKRTRDARARFAPMTPEEPLPRQLPPDPALRRPNVSEDRLGFGGEIGEVE